jgi:hypothetical protein
LRQASSTPHAVQATAEVRLMHPFRPGDVGEAGVLIREFDADALAGLREAVLGYATACGMPEDRAIDVMLAVHELAATGGSSYMSPPAPCTARLAIPARPAATAPSHGRSSKATACGSYTQPPITSA